jgi:aminoglycoside 3-N-acetyltransferase
VTTVSYSRVDLSAHLRWIGIEAGDTLVLHSSLRAIGRVEAGAETVVAALLDALGPAGLLIAPTYTYSTRRFDPATDKSQTGAITEAIRRWPGAVRSWHPTHSVAAIGAGAAELCAGHHLVGPVGFGSPLDRAAQQGGKVLLLGVGHVANSTIHVGETHGKAPYIDIPFSADAFNRATVVTPEGDLDVEITQPSGCSKGFGVIEEALRERGAIRDGMIGGAVSQLMSGRAVIAAVAKRLARDPGGMLCTDHNCYRCMQARLLINRKAAA